jgi:hypothetical protein
MEEAVRRPCRSHLPFVSPYVDTLDDAVFVVEASAGGVSSFGAVALLLDDDDRLLTAVECPACDSPERAVGLCAVLVLASSPAASWCRLVLASSFDVPAAAWSSLAAAVGPSPVDLVGWLVIDLPTGVARSVRQAAEGWSPW